MIRKGECTPVAFYCLVDIVFRYSVLVMIDHFMEKDLSSSRNNPAEAGVFIIDTDVII